MITGAGSLSANTVQLLFGNNNAANTTETGTAATLPGAITVQPENASRAGAAIGKIIEIVAGMNQADRSSITEAAKRAGVAVGEKAMAGTGKAEAGANASDRLFTMDGAKRIGGFNGEYRLVKTGTGKGVSDEQFRENDLNNARKLAAGTGLKAEEAKAYLDAVEKGTVERIDLSTKGVSSTETRTMYYYADGTQKGISGYWTTTGLNDFLEANTVAGEDGLMRDKATGKYAGIEKNGTHYNYVVWG